MSVRSLPAALIALACLIAPAPTAGQSLAAAARAEEARRQKNREKGVKTETVDDKALEAAGGKSGTVSNPGAPEMAATAVTPPSASSGREAGAGRARDESFWRSRTRQAEARLAEVQAAHDRLASMSLVPGYVYQDSKGRTVISSIEQLQAMTAEAKRQLDAARKALDDMHEEARRSGVPPGWLR